MDHDAEYLRRRELRELRMARRARSPHARIVHRDLARIYASRRAAIGSSTPPPPSRWAALAAFLRSLWPGGRRDAGLADEALDSA